MVLRVGTDVMAGSGSRPSRREKLRLFRGVFGFFFNPFYFTTVFVFTAATFVSKNVFPQDLWMSFLIDLHMDVVPDLICAREKNDDFFNRRRSKKKLVINEVDVVNDLI